MRFPGFIGPSYTTRSVNVNCQRSVNLYPEIDETGTAKEREVAALLGTPGLRLAKNVGSGPVRLIKEDPDGRIFVASGATLYRLTRTEGVWAQSTVGSLSTTTGKMNAASSSLHTVFVDGTVNYAFVNATSVFGSFTSLGFSGVPTATHVDYIDGYFIFNESSTNKFWVSDINSLTVSPLDFASAEGNPDDIVALIALNRDLWLFNSKTIEVFSNTGNPDFPFERISGGFVEQGCVAPHSVAKIEGSVFWLSRSETGNGSVYMARGLSPQRVSTHAVEKVIQGYNDMSTAVAYCYKSGGHIFYVINFVEGTWVYDVTTNLWHERAYTSNGVLQRHRANVHSFIKDLGVHLVGDYSDGNVYQLDGVYYTDNGAYITRLRASPHVSSEGDFLFCHSFRLDMETGVGVDGGGQGTSPQAMLQYSDDGGHTWSNEMWASVGAIGKTKTRALWRRLGKFRDRVFRVTITDPIKVALIGAELEVEKGAS